MATPVRWPDQFNDYIFLCRTLRTLGTMTLMTSTRLMGNSKWWIWWSIDVYGPNEWLISSCKELTIIHEIQPSWLHSLFLLSADQFIPIHSISKTPSNDQNANNSFWELWWDIKCSGLVTTWTTSRRTRWRRRPTSPTSSPCRSTSSPLAPPSWLGHQHFRNLFHQKDLETKNPYLVKRLSGTGGLVFYQVTVLVGGTLIWW